MGIGRADEERAAETFGRRANIAFDGVYHFGVVGLACSVAVVKLVDQNGPPRG